MVHRQVWLGHAFCAVPAPRRPGLNTYRNRDANKLSRSAFEPLATAEAMTRADCAAAIARRQRNRDIYAHLTARYDAVITLAAPGPAPIESRGKPAQGKMGVMGNYSSKNRKRRKAPKS